MADSVCQIVEKPKGRIVEKEENQNNNLPEGWNSEPFVDTIEEFKTKQTKIGKIPESWEVGTFKDLCDIVNNTCQPKDNSSLVYVGLEHIDTGSFFLNRFGSPNEVVSSKNKFTKNDVLYGKLRPYLDKAVVADSDGICSTDILVFRPKKNIPPLFLLSILHSSRFMNYAIQTTHGVNHPRTSWKSLQFFKLGIPSFPEQKKIAAVLYNIQKAIETQESIIKTTQELKKSTMQSLFTHGLHGEKTKQTEIGEIPGGWDVITINDLFDMQQGKSLSAKEQTGKYLKPFLRTANVFWGRLDLVSVDKMDINPNEREKLILRDGDLLICEGGDIGRTAIWQDELPECYYQNHVHRLRLKDKKNNSLFYMYWMEVAIRYFGTYGVFGNRTTIPNLSGSRLKAFDVPVPEPNEQKEIATILEAIDKKIINHSSKRIILQEIFNSMIHKLMIGEICVKDISIITSNIEFPGE